MSRWYAALATAVMTAVLIGCPVATDNGRPCFLVKRSADGGSQRITEQEITPGKDFVSFGVSDCEDFVCVRAASTPKSDDPLSDATGKCSSACASPSAKCYSAVSEVKLSCRPLILDEETLGRLCTEQPQKCEQYFDGNKSPYFCAEAIGLDAGI